MERKRLVLRVTMKDVVNPQNHNRMYAPLNISYQPHVLILHVRFLDSNVSCSKIAPHPPTRPQAASGSAGPRAMRPEP